MSQPYQIYDSSGGVRQTGRRPIVLARLPHAGAEARPAGSAPVAAQPSTFSESTRFYVDGQHTQASASETTPIRQGEQEPQTTNYRRHHGPHRRPITERANGGGPQPVMASGISEFHGQFTSYSGLIVTLALAASAALLYWMIIVPSQRPVNDFGNAYDTYGATKIELPEFQFLSAPWVAPQSGSPVTSFDSHPADSPEPSQEDKPAAVVARQAPFRSETLPAEADSPETGDTSPPSAEPAPELIPLSDENDEPALIYNDSSAAAYPTTGAPLPWNWAALGVQEAAMDGEESDPSVPQTAEQPAPAALFR